MSNMSYCRFQNTEKDFQDCVEVLAEAHSLEELELSNEERRALYRMADLCHQFLESYKYLLKRKGKK